MSEKAPAISVIMAVYNTEKYVAEAIESILCQTYRDFEFIIVDDASTDSSADIIEHFQETDNRIRIIRNECNSGLGISLQRGVKSARGQLIARMDADDISLVDRFEKQVNHLNNHPEIMVLGCDHLIINETGEIINDLIYPKNPEIMRWNMLLGSGLIVSNGATMIRKELFDEVGDFGDFRAAQDFEFWSRLFEYDPLPIANLNNVMYYYRQHEKTITKSQSSLQERNAIQVRQGKIEEFLGRSVSPQVVLAYRHPGDNYDDILLCIQTWVEIYERFIGCFQVKKETRAFIKAELVNNLNKYIYIRPNHLQGRRRASFWRVLPFLPINLAFDLLLYKLKWVKNFLSQGTRSF